jgi:hypothetical protein
MSEAEVASHEILTRQLVALLGFDDGADDVLDHLLTVESSEVSAKIVFSLQTRTAPVSSLTQPFATCHLFL